MVNVQVQTRGVEMSEHTKFLVDDFQPHPLELAYTVLPNWDSFGCVTCR